MKRPDILFVVPLPPPWAGVEQVSSLLIDSSLRARFNIHVLKSNIRSSNAAKGAWDFQGISRVFSVAVQLFTRLLFSRPDLVYMTLSQNSAGLARDIAYFSVCRLMGVPVVAHLHGSKLVPYLDSRPACVRSFLKNQLSAIRTIIVCANSIRDELRAALPHANVETVYNACVPVSEAARKNSREYFTVAFMGHLSAAKGFYDLVSAAEIVLESFPETKFQFAGERLDMERNVAPVKRVSWDSVEQVFRRHPKNFHLNGIVTGDAKARFWREADVFVLPSYAEAFPMAVLEAMQAGLPLIVTPVGALPETLAEGRNAFFVEIGDMVSLAEKLKEMIIDRGFAAEMGRFNAIDAARFSPAEMAGRMSDVFESVLRPM